MKSWKIGAIAGLIAGITAISVYEFFSNVAISMGLYEPWWVSIWTRNLFY